MGAGFLIHEPLAKKERSIIDKLRNAETAKFPVAAVWGNEIAHDIRDCSETVSAKQPQLQTPCHCCYDTGEVKTLWRILAVSQTIWLTQSFVGVANLITDGTSFEAGLDGCSLGLIAGRLYRECASVVLEIDRTTAVHGQCSLKFVRPSECRLRYGLLYRPVALRPGQPHTLSVWMKAARAGARGELSLFAAGGSQEGRPGLRPQSQMFPLTTDWKRHELHISKLPASAPVEGDAAKNIYWIVLHADDGGATVWMDAVQLEEGTTATPFAPAKSLELAVASNRPGNQFWAGENIVPQVRLYVPGAKGPVAVSCRVVDVLGDEVATGKKEVRVPADGHLEAELPGFSLARHGWVTIEVTASCDGRTEKEYLNVAVLEKIQPALP
jgi:hypothetical protein